MVAELHGMSKIASWNWKFVGLRLNLAVFLWTCPMNYCTSTSECWTEEHRGQWIFEFHNTRCIPYICWNNCMSAEADTYVYPAWAVSSKFDAPFWRQKGWNGRHAIEIWLRVVVGGIPPLHWLAGLEPGYLTIMAHWIDLTICMRSILHCELCLCDETTTRKLSLHFSHMWLNMNTSSPLLRTSESPSMNLLKIRTASLSPQAQNAIQTPNKFYHSAPTTHPPRTHQHPSKT